MFHVKSCKATAAAALLAVGLGGPVFAQASDAERIATQWMSELKAMGATTAEIGSMSTDGNRLTLSDVRIEWPIKFGLPGKGEITINLSGNSREVVYTNLREVSEGYRFDSLTMANGSSVSASVNVGVEARMTLSFDGYEAKDVLQPRIPTIPDDPERPISRYFVLLKVIPLQEYASFHADEMRLTQVVPGASTVTTFYKDINATNMKGGVLENNTVAEVSQTQMMPIQGMGEVEFSVRVGAQSMRNFDYGHLISLFDPDNYGTAQPETGTKSILESATSEGMTISAKGLFDATIGQFKFENWTPGRPKSSILGFLDEVAKGNEPQPDQIARLVFDVLALYQFDLVEINDINVTTPMGAGGKLGLIRLANVSRDGIGLFNLGGIVVNGPGGLGGKLDNYEVSNIVFPSTGAIMSMVETAVRDDEPSVRQILDVMPMVGGMSLAGFSANIPGGTISLDGVSIAMSDFIPPFPTRLKTETKRLSIPTGLIDERDARRFFTDLGFDSVTFSDGTNIHWDEATQDLVVEGVHFELENGFRAELHAVIGGVPKMVFENPEMAQAAIGTLVFKELEVTFTDKSIVGKAIDFQAKSMGTTADQLKQQIMAFLPQALAPLQNAVFSAKVEAEIRSFLDNPGTLRITAKPANPVPFTEVMRSLQTGPQALPDLFNLDIKAE